MIETDVISSYNNCLATIEDRKNEIADNVLEKILTLYPRVGAFSYVRDISILLVPK